MKINKIMLLFVAILIFGLTSCRSNDQSPNTEYVAFTAGTQTRAIGNKWEGNETFAISYIYDGGEMLHESKKYIISGGASGTIATLIPANEAEAIPIPTNVPSAYYCYWAISPYLGANLKPQIKFSDQTDLLVASRVASTEAQQKNPTLTFTYVMAKVNIILSGENSVLNNIKSIDIKPALNIGSFDPRSGFFELANDDQMVL